MDGVVRLGKEGRRIVILVPRSRKRRHRLTLLGVWGVASTAWWLLPSNQNSQNGDTEPSAQHTILKALELVLHSPPSVAFFYVRSSWGFARQQLATTARLVCDRGEAGCKDTQDLRK